VVAALQISSPTFSKAFDSLPAAVRDAYSDAESVDSLASAHSPSRVGFCNPCREPEFKTYNLASVEQRFLNAMDRLSIKGNWDEIKGKLKQKYAELTDDDLTFIEGKEDELLGRLEKRTGKARDQLRKEIEEL
jgi:uncharacterized protein YjbJ (UPF0337 family)